MTRNALTTRNVVTAQQSLERVKDSFFKSVLKITTINKNTSPAIASRRSAGSWCNMPAGNAENCLNITIEPHLNHSNQILK